MRFVYRKDPKTGALPEKNLYLSANGLGGYCSVSAAGSVTRCDQGLLTAAERAPDFRVTLVHRLRDRLILDGQEYFLSSQNFADGRRPEISCMSQADFGGDAVWTGRIGQVQIRKALTAAVGENLTAVCYSVQNDGEEPCELAAEPLLKMAPKETARRKPCRFRMEGNWITSDGFTLYLKTDGQVIRTPDRWEMLSYPDDEKDGRPGSGLAGSCCEIRFQIPGHTEKEAEILFSREKQEEGKSAAAVIAERNRYLAGLAERAGICDPVGRQLVTASDAYVCSRESTGGKTILAGYPLFSDWGRDTMIALRGCCLTARRLEDAKSILRTFMTYEKEGLMPNLFPERGQNPLYNTADASLLFIDSIWQYYSRTEDLDFVREAWPVITEILKFYCRGTRHGIRMDEDGLLLAGKDLDQVTWMDVRIGNILPTPRHGQPVEINAYW